MVSTKTFLALLASTFTFSSANAFTRFGKHWNFDEVSNCGIFCKRVDNVRVALPADLFPKPNNKCCHTVHINYNGIDIEAPFTDVYTKGAHSQNISLSDEAFQLLAPLSEKELFPVVWKL